MFGLDVLINKSFSFYVQYLKVLSRDIKNLHIIPYGSLEINKR